MHLFGFVAIVGVAVNNDCYEPEYAKTVSSETPPLDALRDRWRALFGRLAEGQDLAPAQLLRTEGMMETLVLLQLATADELQVAMAECYLECFGHSLADRWGDDWAELFAFPTIPAIMARAPVIPSTKD